MELGLENGLDLGFLFKIFFLTFFNQWKNPFFKWRY